LILPVVIRSSQRLSHACLSINLLLWNCERLIISVIVYLIVPYYLDNRKWHVCLLKGCHVDCSRSDFMRCTSSNILFLPSKTCHSLTYFIYITGSNSRANTCVNTLMEWYLLDWNQPLRGDVVIHNKLADRMAFAGDGSFKFLPYQLWMVGYWPTMALTGNGKLGFDSGEGAWETATTSKEGSRRVNYPIPKRGGSDNK